MTDSIDIDNLSRQELIELNRRIVERIKLLNFMRTQTLMLEFRVGERVSFETRDNDIIVGTLVKFNRKTVTITANDGESWNVAPSHISRAEERTKEHQADGILIEMNEGKTA